MTRRELFLRLAAAAGINAASKPISLTEISDPVPFLIRNKVADYTRQNSTEWYYVDTANNSKNGEYFFATSDELKGKP